MLVFRGPSALRQLCACALLSGAVLGAQATEPVAPDEGALNLDQAVQSLKDEGVELNRDAQMAEETFLFPPATRLAVYVSNRIRNLLLTEVSVRLDDRQPVVYRYGEIDSRALLEKGALQRLILTNVDRGVHRLSIAYSGRFMDGDQQTGEFAETYQAVFDKGLDASELELEIRRGKRKGAPAMDLKEWRAAEE